MLLSESLVSELQKKARFADTYGKRLGLRGEDDLLTCITDNNIFEQIK